MNKLKRSICIGLAMTFILGAGVYALDLSSINSDNLTYEADVNYAQIMINSCEEGSDDALLRAAECEIQRNMKIEDLDLDYEQTHFFELLDDSEEIIEAVRVFAETGNIYGVTELSVEADILNCREAAGIEYEKVARFKEASVVTFLSQETDDEGNLWYQISFGDDITGWCMAEYLAEHVKSASEVAAQVSAAASAAKTTTSDSTSQTDNATEASSYTEDDLYYLAAAITKEAGSDWITDEHQLMVGNVILNRVASSSYPDTIYGVLTQKGQYPWASKGISLTPTEKAYANAKRLLDGERVLPDNVVYQSTVTQGSGTYTSIYDATLGTTTYFCYY